MIVGTTHPAQSPPRCTNVTAHPSTANVPITVLLYDCPLLCGFNVTIKGLMSYFVTGYLHAKQCIPSASTGAPYRRVWTKQTLQLRHCRATAT